MAGKGRKPKGEAIRKAHQAKVLDAQIVDSSMLVMPPEVAQNAAMRECWEWETAGARQYSQADVPMLTALCTWWAIQRQALENISSDDGSAIVTTYEDMEGKRRVSPDLKNLKEATNQIRLLSSELGIGPLSKSRMNLNSMLTQSVAADIPAKIFAAVEAARGQIEAPHGD